MALKFKMETLIESAQRVATKVHAGTFRKFITPPQPYIEHPRAVAARLEALALNGLLVGDPSTAIATGWTHDVLEDPSADGKRMTRDELASLTSPAIAVSGSGTHEPKQGLAPPPRRTESHGSQPPCRRVPSGKDHQDDRPNAQPQPASRQSC